MDWSGDCLLLCCVVSSRYFVLLHRVKNYENINHLLHSCSDRGILNTIKAVRMGHVLNIELLTGRITREMGK